MGAQQVKRVSFERVGRGLRRRVRPRLVAADDAVHRLVGLTVAEHDARFPVVIPLHPDHVEMLGDPAFIESCREVRDLTLLDTARLANLWSLSRQCDRRGSFIEVGSFRGGGALHLSNSDPDRQIFVCDSFAGFDHLDETLDSRFGSHMFTDTRRDAVEDMFRSRGRNATVLAGFFPRSADGVEVGPLSFAHVDVDVYEATRDTLRFICPLMTNRSMIVLDDVGRHAAGVDAAISEFVAEQPDWLAFPLFPGQGVLFSRSWFA